MNMGSSKVICTICHKNSTSTERTIVQQRSRNSKSTTNESWESVWTERCAESACKLLDLQLDIFKEYFLTNQQCSSCKQLLRDVDFVIRCIDSMNVKVSQLRLKLARMLYENIRKWTDENTEPEVRASKAIEHPIGNSAVEYDDEESICAGSFILGSDLKEEFSETTAQPGFESVPVPKITDVFQIKPDSIQTEHLRSIESSEATHKGGQENSSSIKKCSFKSMNENPSPRSSNRIRKAVQYREDTDEEEGCEKPDSGSKIEERPKSGAKRKSSTAYSEGEAAPKRCRISVPHRIFEKNIQQKIPDTDPAYVVRCQEEPEFGDGFRNELEPDAEATNPSQINIKLKLRQCIKRRRLSSEVLVEKLQNREEVIEETVAQGHSAPISRTETNTRSVTRIKRKRRNAISRAPFRSATVKLPAQEDKELLSTVRFLKELERQDKEKNYTFICTGAYCDRRFISYRELRRHHAAVHGQLLFRYDFQCPFCDLYVQFDYMLDAHIIRVHQQQKHGYICPAVDCDMTFVSNAKLVSHASFHHPGLLKKRSDYSYRAQFAQYRDKSLVGSSEAVVIQRAKRMFVTRRMTYCPVEGCSVRCSSQLLMDRHYNKVHVKDPFPYKCSQLDCTKAFKTENSLYRHMAIIHEITGNGALINCLFCHYRCPGQSFVNQHMRISHHKNDAPKFYCKVCNLLFFTTEHCEEHEKLHDNKGYDCVIFLCTTKRFSNRDELVSHVKCEHDGSYRKKYVCSTCGKAMRTAYQLRNHMAIHSSDLPFKCTYCDKSFRTPTNRKSHLEIMHGDQLQKKTYNCKLCDATFTACQYLYKHNAWHKYGANANLPVAKKKQRNPEEAIQDTVEAPEIPTRRLRSQTEQKC